MTITEQKAFLESYLGRTVCPADFSARWQQAADALEPHTSAQVLPIGNANGIYETLTVTDGTRTLSARSIRPAAPGKYPLMLLFHDLNRGVRGWHHMTRYLAFGYGVVALDAEPFRGDWRGNPERVDFGSRYRDALLLGKAALTLPWVDKARVVAFGEGFGGGLALLCGALLPGAIPCAALNPLPGDFRGVGLEGLDSIDLVNFAPLCRGEVLLGTSLMDTYAPPSAQAAIYNRLTCPKEWKLYPKYAHERINFFENQLLYFLQHGVRV